jgi:hypothetical protein
VVLVAVAEAVMFCAVFACASLASYMLASGLVSESEHDQDGQNLINGHTLPADDVRETMRTNPTKGHPRRSARTGTIHHIHCFASRAKWQVRGTSAANRGVVGRF